MKDITFINALATVGMIGFTWLILVRELAKWWNRRKPQEEQLSLHGIEMAEKYLETHESPAVRHMYSKVLAGTDFLLRWLLVSYVLLFLICVLLAYQAIKLGWNPLEWLLGLGGVL